MYRFRIPVLFSLLIFIFSCEEEIVERDHPRLRTGKVTNITADGARFVAEVTNTSGKTIIEHGFLWGTSDYLTENYSEKVYLGPMTEQGSFYFDNDFGLIEGYTYYVRAFVKTGDLVIYGETVKFKSLGSMAPVISGFLPEKGTWGDTVVIYGDHFSHEKSINLVLFGEKVAKVIECSNKYIKVNIPDNMTEDSVTISVVVLGNRCTSQNKFSFFSQLKFYSINKNVITWYDTLRITGEFPDSYDVNVMAGEFLFPKISQLPTELTVKIPYALDVKDLLAVTLKIGGNSLMTPFRLSLKKPAINEILPANFGWLDTITVYGTFNPVPDSNLITFGSQPATILSCTKTQAICVVPITVNDHDCQMKLLINNYQWDTLISLAGPKVTSIYMTDINNPDNITIEGQYFKPGSTTVTINGAVRTILYSTPDKLVVGLDNVANGPANIQVQVYDKFILNSDFYCEVLPVIYDFSPKNVTFTDDVTITGENFNTSTLKAQIGSYKAEILSASKTEIKIRVPVSITSVQNYIYIYNGYLMAKASDYLNMYPPVIYSIDPLTGKEGDIITIYGQYFNPSLRDLNEIHLGSYVCEVTYSTQNRLKFKLPSALNGNYYINVNSGVASVTSTQTFLYSNP